MLASLSLSSSFLEVPGKTIFRVCQIIGIVPLSFNFNSHTAKASTFWRCYTAVILITITAFTPGSTSTINSQMDFLKQKRLMYFVGSNRCVVLHLCAIFSVLIQLFKDRNLVYCCNQAIRIFDSLRALSIDRSDVVLVAFDRNFLLRIVVKLIALWPVTQTTVFYITNDGALENIQFLFALLSQYYCQLVIYMTLNMFYVATLMLTSYTRHLNRCMKRTFREIRVLRTQPGRGNSLKMQKYCELADILDRIIGIYKKVAALTRLVNQQYQVQICCSLVYIPIEWVVQCYFTYFIYTHNRARFVWNFGALFFIASLFLEIFLIINATERLMRVFAETKWIVRMGAEVGKVDDRLEKMIEQFSMYLDNERTQYSLCGLINMDNRCLMMMGQCLLTSLLILIQFDTILV
ncbi:putative gustatory receptor 77a [Eupeodes corollae]|uniref:putative gustatory receptor 77a n=1 Tax=Eupeodes corollae TaxID=290404 RepID=UPI002493A393|nr:putative gustatory receptor 77a [Eupeodes corollae]